MLYLTYNDSPSGIYHSQVIDVCNFLNTKLNAHIRLVSIISSRNFFSNKKKIRSYAPNAIVIPMFPGVKNWRWNFYSLFFLFIFLDSKKVIARGPFAATLAIWLKKMGIIKWICFDARGAYDAELNEYDVVTSKKIKNNILEIEKNAILNSDFQMAVSNKLVQYWKEKFGYNSEKYVVIPCLLHSKFFSNLPDAQIIFQKRSLLGYKEKDIVLVYSGSMAGWQSMELLDKLLYNLFKQNEKIKILFLAKALPEKMKIINEFDNRVICKWVQEEEVRDILSCCDYGILLRERSTTNKVASPVKFPEYLASGLKVLISEDLGDYTEFVEKEDCGIVVGEPDQDIQLQPTSYSEKQMLYLLALENFSKEVYISAYKKIAE